MSSKPGCPRRASTEESSGEIAAFGYPCLNRTTPPDGKAHREVRKCRVCRREARSTPPLGRTGRTSEPISD